MEEDYLNDLLDDCDYPRDEKLRKSVITQLRNLQENSLNLFNQWKKTHKIAPDAFDIEGITPLFLKTKRRMEDIAIILAYDGLLREPRKSAALLKEPVIKRRNQLFENVVRGTLSFPGDNEYCGEYLNGLPHGEGKMIYGNGAIYYGFWENGRREGVGQFYQPSGTILSGTWHNGQLSEGISIDAKGNHYAGNFNHNKFNGKGALFLTDGSWAQGDWENDELKDGRVFFADGRMHIIVNKEHQTEQQWKN